MQAFYLIDTFTEEKFKGSPTPVCILDRMLDSDTMQSLANEFNAPVTAFLEPLNNLFYPIRYFTITGEIPACGHATLGASFVFLSHPEQTSTKFKTIEQVELTAKIYDGFPFVEYPKYSGIDFEVPPGVTSSLGIKTFATSFFCRELQSLFVELDNEEEVRQLKPDYSMLIKSSNEIKEVVVMSKSDNLNYDFVLRSFCPWIGIDEDPITGSIHSVLGHFWQKRLGKNELSAYQASARGGQIFVRPLNNSVAIGGQCKIIVDGQLRI